MPFSIQVLSLSCYVTPLLFHTSLAFATSFICTDEGSVSCTQTPDAHSNNVMEHGQDPQKERAELEVTQTSA
eukprot:scaffold17051_cov124-Skeletonema_dohrnii-CCMP3373.AAC.5